MNNEIRYIETISYKRPAVCCKLKDFDSTYTSDDYFAEVCEWENGNGFDIAVNDRTYSFSYGEFNAITYILNILRRENLKNESILESKTGQ